MSRSEIGEVQCVKSKVCSFLKGKIVILRLKVNTFEKHARKTSVVQNMSHLCKKQGELYVNKKCNHANNEVAYYKKNRITIAE